MKYKKYKPKKKHKLQLEFSQIKKRYNKLALLTS